MPPNSARITLVNDVNFLLYTPFLPEAAAGTLEPRHVVTPLRDVLKDTRLRMGAVVGRDGARRTVTYRDQEGADHELRYDRLVVAHGRCRACCRSPAWPSTPSASRASRTRSGCETTSSLPGDRRRVDRRRAVRGAADLRVRRRRLRRPRGARRAAGLRRRGAALLSRARSCTACAGSWSRQPTACCWRPSRSSPTTRAASCAGAGSTSGSATTLEEVTADSVRLSTGETIPAKTRRVDGGRRVRTRACANLGLPLDERGRIRVDDHLLVEGERGRLGGRRLRGRSRPRQGRLGPSPPTSQHAIRQGRAAGRNVAASLGRGQGRGRSPTRRWASS